jgi:hypothetical protein
MLHFDHPSYLPPVEGWYGIPMAFIHITATMNRFTFTLGGNKDNQLLFFMVI